MNKTTSSAALAWGGVWAAGALWGIGAWLAQWLIEGGVSPWTLALARFGFGLPLLWWWHWRRSPAGLWQRLPWAQRGGILATGAAMALNVGCWFAGIAHLGAAVPTVVSICCAPVLVAAMAVLRGHERLTVALTVGLALALVGVGLLVMPAQTQMPTGWAVGLAWSFASAFLYALVVMGNARMPTEVPAVAASAWSMTMATACAAVLAVAAGLAWPVTAGRWLGLVYTGVLATSAGYLLFAWAARRLTPTATVVGTLVEPLVAALLAAWLSGEAMAPRQGLGSALLGVAMVWLVRRR